MIRLPERCEDRHRLYALLQSQLKELIAVCPRPVPSLANAAALLNDALTEINWAGFYIYEETARQLVLGPFQGHAACILIPVGKGVCGTAAAERRAQLVPDVNAFPGHIACDSASRSEVVIPLLLGERLLGVLDIDSPVPARFDEADAAGLSGLAALLCEAVDWSDFHV